MNSKNSASTKLQTPADTTIRTTESAKEMMVHNIILFCCSCDGNGTYTLNSFITRKEIPLYCVIVLTDHCFIN